MRAVAGRHLESVSLRHSSSASSPIAAPPAAAIRPPGTCPLQQIRRLAIRYVRRGGKPAVYSRLVADRLPNHNRQARLSILHRRPQLWIAMLPKFNEPTVVIGGFPALPLAAQALAQRLPLDQRHHVVEQPVGVAGIIERQDVRMMQAGGDLDLTEEALGTQGGRQLETEYFHGHLAVVLQILGEINQSHPP